MTPGQHQKHSLAGALDLATGTLLHCVAASKTNAWVRDLLTLVPTPHYPTEHYTRCSMGGRALYPP